MSSLVRSRAAGVATHHGHSSRLLASTNLERHGNGLLGSAVGPLPAGLSLLSGTAGEHHAIHEFLLGIFREPSLLEFQAQLDEPGYEPSDRLIFKHGAKIVSHIRMQHREMWFGGETIPVTMLSELATDPEYRRRGCARILVAEAERRLAAENSILALVRTTTPQVFAKHGWVPWDQRFYTRAGARDVLAQLSLEGMRRNGDRKIGMRPERRTPLSTRIWRHVEQSWLTRLFESFANGLTGTMCRVPDYWRWLISRHAFDCIYVTIEGKDRMELDDAKIVSYAVVRQDRILEFASDRSRPDAMTQTLSRICHDCIEDDRNWIRYDGPWGDRVHELFAAARGTRGSCGVENGTVQMAKLVSPWNFFERRLPRICDDAIAHGLNVPAEIGVVVGDQRKQVQITRKEVCISEGKTGRACISLGPTEFSQALLGQLNWSAAIREGRVECSSRAAAELAELLFPKRPLWVPPWDWLAAR